MSASCVSMLPPGTRCSSTHTASSRLHSGASAFTCTRSHRAADWLCVSASKPEHRRTRVTYEITAALSLMAADTLPLHRRSRRRAALSGSNFEPGPVCRRSMPATSSLLRLGARGLCFLAWPAGTVAGTVAAIVRSPTPQTTQYDLSKPVQLRGYAGKPQ